MRLAPVAESVDAADLKSADFIVLRVRVPLEARMEKEIT